MISHVVLMKPRSDLSKNDRAEFVAAFERALTDIPSVRGVRVGRRVMMGASYDALGPDVADYVAIVDFDDQDGLKQYLAHAAHADLGARFYQVLSSALVYDFEVGGAEKLAELSRA
jgi:stress responsive alpha/beta barrel protein